MHNLTNIKWHKLQQTSEQSKSLDNSFVNSSEKIAHKPRKTGPQNHKTKAVF